ncbi:MAG: hypothetical protein K9N49_03355, partial [Candidatus Marinimicrobia bacterium]|nr:hypothetical protein [Candidatus Neomarinimicrobiota bacterium]
APAPPPRPPPAGCPPGRPGPGLARPAAVGLVLGGGIWIGRRAAPVPTASPRRTDAVSTIQSAAVESPWARYQVAYDERTGGHVLAQYQ